MTGPRSEHDRQQAFAAVREIAAMVSRYVEALEEEGFSRAEAITLAASYQDTMLKLGEELNADDQ